MKEYSSRAQKVIELLSDEEIRQIQRDNPFRVERNDKIRELRRRGVYLVVLVEVSGMSKATIQRLCVGITPFPKNRSKGNGPCPS